jgi:single-stranded-DNA-specific exonuclease
MEDMTSGVNCLLSKNPEQAFKLAEALNTLNLERRHIQQDMKTQALVHIHEKGLLENTTLTLFDESWHPGVIGLLASYLKDHFCRPVIIFAASSEGALSGSGRSVAGFHLCDALANIDKSELGLLQRFGGHEMAAGLRIAKEALTRFSKAFESIGQKYLTHKMLEPSHETDGHLDNQDITIEMALLLKNQVWGKGFEEPLFYDNFAVLSQKRVAEKHLKLILKKEGEVFEGIYFYARSDLPDHIQAVYQMTPNTWRSQMKVQLMIKDWRADG